MFHFGESVYWTYKMCSPEPLPLLIDEKKGDKNQYMGCGWKRSAKQNDKVHITFPFKIESMGKTLGQILMDEARQTGLQEWMKKVQVTVRQTDVKNPVTWMALERLSRDEDNMPCLVKLLKEHCPCPSLKTQEEPAYLILAAYHNDNDSLGYLLDTMKVYIKKKDHDGILFLCRMQAAINDNEDYPHLNGLYNELTGYLLSCRRDRVKEYRKGNIPVFSEADLQVAEKYLPHLKEYSFRDKVMAVFPTAKTITELADKCGCAVNTFERRFKEEFGAAPRKWMMEQKAKRVVTLLTHTNLPMKEIAGDCGFESSNYFWDFCRRNLNATPTQIREGFMDEQKSVD